MLNDFYSCYTLRRKSNKLKLKLQITQFINKYLAWLKVSANTIIRNMIHYEKLPTYNWLLPVRSIYAKAIKIKYINYANIRYWTNSTVYGTIILIKSDFMFINIVILLISSVPAKTKRYQSEIFNNILRYYNDFNEFLLT